MCTYTQSIDWCFIVWLVHGQNAVGMSMAICMSAKTEYPVMILICMVRNAEYAAETRSLLYGRHIMKTQLKPLSHT